MTLFDMPERSALGPIIDAFGPVEGCGLDDPIYTCVDGCLLTWPHEPPCIEDT
jgi:hypothetical protein